MPRPNQPSAAAGMLPPGRARPVQVAAWSGSPPSGLLITEHDGARRGRLSPDSRASTAIKIGGSSAQAVGSRFDDRGQGDLMRPA